MRDVARPGMTGEDGQHLGGAPHGARAEGVEDRAHERGDVTDPLAQRLDLDHDVPGGLDLRRDRGGGGADPVRPRPQHFDRARTQLRRQHVHLANEDRAASGLGLDARDPRGRVERRGPRVELDDADRVPDPMGATGAGLAADEDRDAERDGAGERILIDEPRPRSHADPRGLDDPAQRDHRSEPAARELDGSAVRAIALLTQTNGDQTRTSVPRRLHRSLTQHVSFGPPAQQLLRGGVGDEDVFVEADHRQGRATRVTREGVEECTLVAVYGVRELIVDRAGDVLCVGHDHVVRRRDPLTEDEEAGQTAERVAQGDPDRGETVLRLAVVLLPHHEEALQPLRRDPGAVRADERLSERRADASPALLPGEHETLVPHSRQDLDAVTVEQHRPRVRIATLLAQGSQDRPGGIGQPTGPRGARPMRGHLDARRIHAQIARPQPGAEDLRRHGAGCLDVGGAVEEGLSRARDPSAHVRIETGRRVQRCPAHCHVDSFVDTFVTIAARGVVRGVRSILGDGLHAGPGTPAVDHGDARREPPRSESADGRPLRRGRVTHSANTLMRCVSPLGSNIRMSTRRTP